jgi:hypothetical protein
MALRSTVFATIYAFGWPEECWNCVGISKWDQRRGEEKEVPGTGGYMNILSCKVYLWSGSRSVIIPKPTLSTVGVGKPSDG